MNKDPQFPQNRPIWNDTDIEAGEFVSFDPGQMSVSRKIAATRSLEVGVFAMQEAVDTLEVAAVRDDPTGEFLAGVSIIDNNSKNYPSGPFDEKEIAPIARRGFVSVKINTANPPVVGQETHQISFEALKQGFIGGVGAASSRALSGTLSGVEVVRVGAEVAEVYLAGKALMAI